MKFSLKGTLRHTALSVLSVLSGVFLGATLVGAATTISTNITTAGTFNADSTATFGSTVAVTGSTTLAGLLNVGGAAMLSSTTATSLKVGQTGTLHTGMVSGYCTIAATGGATAAHTASTTKQFTCASATGVTTSDRVFVQATSSMPVMFVVQAATSSTGAIEIAILNTGLGTTTAGGLAGPTSLNFWAVR